MTRSKLKTRTLPVRLSDAEFDLIDAAARALGENRSEFLRNAAKEKANKINEEAA
ncbi:DUF1778 domain-containing protein [Pseudanabaena sp. PCC 6802]|uniref:type II toxin -antitoxin system TacA 1-like antitoxin n=1 Tax=Pseudanabaena sp. PCC 6802 TaxID=118173 RepID=UPI00036DED6B